MVQESIRTAEIDAGTPAGEQLATLRHDLEAAIHGMVSLAEHREAGGGGHIRRIGEYAMLLARALSGRPPYDHWLTPRRIELLRLAAPLHDIGKMAIPDRILLKGGPLNRTEWEEMKRHTQYGRDALQRAEAAFGGSDFLEVARIIAYTHHERWDGRGYPEGLVAEEIPVPGQIMALADVYDALISVRVYRSAVSHREAVDRIRRERGAHFAPAVVDAFLEQEAAFQEVVQRFSDDGQDQMKR